LRPPVTLLGEGGGGGGRGGVRTSKTDTITAGDTKMQNMIFLKIGYRFIAGQEKHLKEKNPKRLPLT